MAFDYSVKFKAIDKISRVVDGINNKMDSVKTGAKKLSSSIQNAFNGINLTSTFKLNIQEGLQKIKKIKGKLKEISKKPIDISLSFRSLIATGATLGVPVQRAIEFEKAFAGVKKVADGTAEEINKLNKDILNLTRTIPKTASEISAMIEAGAKMGFSIHHLEKFAIVTSKASVAFDMSAEATGEAFGKISTQLGFTIPQLEEFGDKVNHLADTTASSASNIIDITKRTAGVMSTLKFDTSTIVGLSAFADQMSVSSEIGATAMNQILNGMRKTEFGAKMLEEKGGFALIDLADKFKKLQGTARTKALAKMFGAGEGARMFEKLINRTDQLKKSLDLAFSKDTLGSMTREFENVSDTTANKIILIRNSLDRLAINIGNVLLPSVRQIIESLAPIIDKVTLWASENKDLIITIAKILTVSALLTAGILTLKLAVTPILILMKAYVVVTKAITLAMWLFNAVLVANPIGLIVLGVTALVVGFGYLVGGVNGAIDAFKLLVSPITFVLNLLDQFLSKFEIFNQAKDKIAKVGEDIGNKAQGAIDSVKSFFNIGDTELKKENVIDNTTKNHTVVDVNVKAIGSVVTDENVKSTGRVKLNTASENGV